MPRLRKAKSSASAGSSHRTKVVWASLLAAMTLVGGLLVMLDDRPAPRAAGISLTPLVATGTTSNIESIFNTDKPLATQRWNSIVIHHSKSVAGGPNSIEAEHRAQGLKGLGHHFIIGNGRGGEMADGELHVGFRWLSQLPGAHAVGPRGTELNNHALSICLVGDGSRQKFSRAQMARLNQLVEALCAKLNIPADKVYLASEVSNVKDPGPLFPESEFRARLNASKR